MLLTSKWQKRVSLLGEDWGGGGGLVIFLENKRILKKKP